MVAFSWISLALLYHPAPVVQPVGTTHMSRVLHEIDWVGLAFSPPILRVEVLISYDSRQNFSPVRDCHPRNG